GWAGQERAAGPERSAGQRALWQRMGGAPLVALSVFGLLAVVNFALFYGSGSVAGQSSELRRTALLFAAAPDELLAMWCGGKLEYFSLLDRWPIAALTAVIFGVAWLAGRLA